MATAKPNIAKASVTPRLADAGRQSLQVPTIAMIKRP